MKNVRSLVQPLLLGLLLVLMSAPAIGSHILGADLGYTYLSGTSFEFKLVLYRDCGGIPTNPTEALSLIAPSCGINGGVTIFRQSTVEISPLCVSQTSNSTCNNGTLPGIEQQTYSGTVNIGQCSNWTVSWNSCCRSFQVTNLDNPGSTRFYVEARYENLNGLNNSSPSFTTPGVQYLCNQQQFCFNPGAVDPDGDSLVYTLISALEGISNPVPVMYAVPNSGSYPINTLSGSVAVDSQTGTMCITPVGQQYAVVAIQVDEFRNGVFIGSSMRDMQFVVQNCGNQQPQLTSNGIVNLVGGVQLDSNSIGACVGEAIVFNLQFEDADSADILAALTNLGNAIPGATFTTSGDNPVTGTFSWTPGAGDTGFHNFTVTVQDNGCPILGSQVFAFDLFISEAIHAGPDLDFCESGSPVGLSASGGTAFTWSTISGDSMGLSCVNCPNPLASPSVTSSYELVSNQVGCPNRDTVTVFLIPEFTIDAGPDTSICKGDTLSLNGILGPVGSAPFSFTWTPTDSLSNPNALSLQANPESTATYTLTATSVQGCTLSDSIVVDILEVAPLVFLPQIDTICPGTPTAISPVLSFACDTSNVPCSAPGSMGMVSNGTLSGSDFGPTFMDPASEYGIRRQYIFTPAELNAMGFQGGRIKSLGLNFTSAGSPVNHVRIAMGCTSQSEFGSSSNAFISGLIEVKSTFVISPVLGWNDFALDHGYSWDGVSNLVVQFCTKDPNQGMPSNVEYGCLPSRDATLYLNETFSGACDSLLGIPSKCRPNMRFEYCEAVPVGTTFLWSPAIGLNNVNVQEPIASLLNNTSYELIVDNGSGCLGRGGTTLVIDSSLSLVAMADDPSPCAGQLVTLSSNVTGQAVPPQSVFTYAWSPSTGLANLDSATTTLLFSGPIVYTLAVSDGRCQVTDTVSLEDCGIVPVDLIQEFDHGSGFISLYPNPAKGGGSLQLKYWAAEGGPMQLEWIDALGRMVGQANENTTAGLNQFGLSTEALAEGVYFLRMRCGTQVDVRKVVLQR